MRTLVLRILIVGWLLAPLAAAAAAQRARDPQEVPYSTQLLIERERAGNEAALSEIRLNLAVMTKTAIDARDEVHEMRVAVWGCAGTILISLFMQLAQIRKTKGSS